ncbi:MAG: hypothetical protein U0228_21515 [Myxococcaceae bacterium]
MRHSGSISATATRIPTTHTRTVYATDRGVARPLSESSRRLVEHTGKRIRVGSTSATPWGELRCFAQSGCLVVELTRAGERVGRALIYRPTSAEALQHGALVPEAHFSVEVREFIGTPWHEDESLSLWTVHGLRSKGTAERFVQL